MKDKETKGVALVSPTSAEALIGQAIQKGVDVGTMERLLAMRTQIKAEQAKEAFNRAMAAFQAECPTIVKTKEVRTRSGIVAYKYAPIESIVSQVKPYLQRNGFSYTTQIDLTEKGVRATCKVVHEAGHTEESSMEVPLGNKTDIMSQSQVTAAASTFAKRYAFCNAFGILTGDEDNDGAKFDDEPISDKAVPLVTYDDHEEESDIGEVILDVAKVFKPVTPLQSPPNPIKEKKNLYLANIAKWQQIKEIINNIVQVELDQTKEAYAQYILDNTGIVLKAANYDKIIDALTKIKHGEVEE